MIVLLLLGLLPAAASALDFDVEIQAPKHIREVIEAHLDLLRWRGDPNLSSGQLGALYGQAQDEIAELLATEGYYSPQITGAMEEQGQRWRIRFTVAPGEPTRVADVDLHMIGLAGGIEQIRQDWPLKPGAIFRQADWEAAKRAPLQSLAARSYAAARITESRATVDPKTASARLRVVYDSGPPIVFGELSVEGLRRYPESVVRNLSPIHPGDPYAPEKLSELQSRLQASGYFSGTVVRAELDPNRPGPVPVVVGVTERPSKKLGFGLGYSTNTGARGQVEYQDFDLLSRAWRLHSRLRIETRRQGIDGEIERPTRASGYRDSVGAKIERTDLNGELTHKAAVGVKRARTVGTNDSLLSLQYQTERREVEGSTDVDHLQALTLNQSWTRRRVDDLLNPSRGYLFNVQLGGATSALLSDQSFLRAYGKWTRFYPAGSRGTVVLYLEGGAVAAKSRRGIPSDFLFRTGGDTSVRGYSYQSLGVTEGSAVVGGRYLGVASAEYLYRITPKWSGAVFYDLGNATDSLKDFKAAHGYGVGARWRSPVGPISLDLAYGQEVREYRVHFSVGFAF